MARNRMIKPEFWSSKTLMRVSCESRLTFIGMWNFADDYGVLLDSNRRLLGDIFPLDESMTEAKMQKMKSELIDVGLLVVIEDNGKSFLFIKGWNEHQTVPHKSKRYHIEPDLIDGLVKLSCESHASLMQVACSKDKVKEKVKCKDKDKGICLSDEDLNSSFDDFWKQTKFPKRPQDTKGDIKKKYLACIKTGLTPEDILFASDVFAEVNRSNNFPIGLRKFMEPDTVKEYLKENVAAKDPEEAKWDRIRALEARLEQERLEELAQHGEHKDELLYILEKN